MQKESTDLIPTSTINPVDYCNLSKVQEVLDFLCTLRNVKKVGLDSITYIENKSDETKRMIVIENGFFIAKLENGLRMPVNKKFTAFMMLQKFKYKNNFNKTLFFVMREYMNHKSDYIRVGVKYYKIISKYDRYGIDRKVLKLWEKSIINDDLGKSYLEDIQKYDDFTIEPNNKNYSRIINNNYNLYSPFVHQPILPELYENDKQWTWINKMIHHIFGEQYDLGIKYLKVLYDHPKQVLPILVLVSEERQTGKTTFVDFLTILFGANMVIINPKDISNDFNGSYADKNVIAIEESRFENTQATEKLKNLSTQKKIMVNNKFVAHYSIPFYGKLIITSNDRHKFSKVDNPEIRYWVREIPTLEGKANHEILEDMVSEIPYFLAHLNRLKPVDLTKSRMVFTADEIKTQALATVKKESLPELHKEIEFMLKDFCQQNTTLAEVKFTALDLKEKWFDKNSKYTVSYINKIIKISMKLERGNQQRYIPFCVDKFGNKKNGKPYIYKNEYLDELDIQETERD